MQGERFARMKLAGNALVGILACGTPLPPSRVAELAVQYADAVLLQLQRTQRQHWSDTPDDRDHEAAVVDKLVPVPSGDGGGP